MDVQYGIVMHSTGTDFLMDTKLNSNKFSDDFVKNMSLVSRDAILEEILRDIKMKKISIWCNLVKSWDKEGNHYVQYGT